MTYSKFCKGIRGLLVIFKEENKKLSDNFKETLLLTVVERTFSPLKVNMVSFK